MHAPLIIRSPNHLSTSKGIATRTLAEFIDIYPTLCELAGVAPPKKLDGRSLIPVLENPKDPGKGFAIGRFRDGDTIRTDKWRYTEYASTDNAGKLKIVARMLYDHDRDPEENRNLANLPEYASLIAEFSKRLNTHKGK